MSTKPDEGIGAGDLLFGAMRAGKQEQIPLPPLFKGGEQQQQNQKPKTKKDQS
jgi:hypothetical protein